MSPSGPISLRVTAPVCSFRKGYAREYLETEEVPPPSTVYGFLLSLIGEEDRRAYEGARIALCLLSQPELSTVLRTVWRAKALKDKSGARQPPGVGSNRRPDFQEIFTGLDMVVCVDGGPLAERLRIAAGLPCDVQRFGGLSLGESHDLVNDIWWDPDLSELSCRWLTLASYGDLTLPVWVDHVGSKGTVWRQFLLQACTTRVSLADDPRWIKIEGPSAEDGQRDETNREERTR